MRPRSSPGRGHEAAPDQRNWAVAAQLVSFAGYLFPLANVAGPLVIWLMKRHESPFVEDHAREALNFQISMTIYLTVAGLLVYLLIGFLLLPLLVVFDVVVVVLAALAASRGEVYRYPLSIRLVS